MSTKARSLLEKCLICSFRKDFSEPEQRQEVLDLRIYVLKLIFNMFRANSIKFNAFFIEILINSLVEATSTSVGSSINDLNDQYTTELTINMIEYFFNVRPDLVDAYFELSIFNKDKILSLLSNKDKKTFQSKSNVMQVKLQLLLNRFLLSKHFSDSMTIQQVRDLERTWNLANYDRKYFQLLERNAFDSRAIHSLFADELEERSHPLPPSADTQFTSSRFVKLYRRVGDEIKNDSAYSAARANVYTPFHLNSAIIRLRVFEANNFRLSDEFQSKIIAYLRLIRTGMQLQNTTTCKLKQALWAVCSFLNCETGFRFLVYLMDKPLKDQQSAIFKNLFEFTSCLVKLAECHPVLSVRATTLLCLNYVSKTCTGANLVGKLGWHTFQPNCAVQTKAFYSVLSTFTSEQLDLKNFYSSLNIAVVLYNLNRAKAQMSMRRIANGIHLSEFSSEEREFLDAENATDLLALANQEFMRMPEQNLLNGFFHENFCVPIQVHLMSPLTGKRPVGNSGLGGTGIPDGLVVDKECLACHLRGDSGEEGSDIKKQIVQLIQQYLIMKQLFSVESTQVSLVKLRLTRGDRFDMCLHSLISRRLLGVRKIKFHMRKFIQELFFDMSLEVFFN